MTATLNQSASEITFYDTYLNTSLIDMDLTAKYNCGSSPVTKELTSKIAGISANSFVLSLTDYYGGSTTNTKFLDGVYDFQIVIKYMSSGQLVTRTFNICLLVDYDLKCLYLKKQQDTYDKYLSTQYKTMYYSNTCDDCDCSKLCLLYNDLLSTLTSTTTTNVTNCGCE